MLIQQSWMSSRRFSRHFVHLSQDHNLFYLIRQLTTQAKPDPIPVKSRYRQRFLWAVALLSGVYGLDYGFNASSITRSIRAVRVLSIVGIDLAINFKEGNDINALHARVADRVYNLINDNGGVYIKMGQAIAMNGAVLPPIIQAKFAKLFDKAPQDEWSEIEQVFGRDFDKSPDDIFEYIDHDAIASASIGQVHKAKLRTGEWVAVKIQHPKIRKQLEWDLGTYRAVMYFYDWYFELPVYFTVDYTCNRLKSETNFLNEAGNAENMRAALKTNSMFNDSVYIPKVYDEFTSEHVLTAEWIDGTSLSDRAGLEQQKFSKSRIMDIMVNLFSAQIFSFGVVHCDPHPGNQIIRMHNGKLQLVLIDHGLYIYMNPKFRQQYCELWKAMFTVNDTVIKDVAQSWGIGTPELFASATMLRPYKGKRPQGKGSSEADMKEDFEMQSRMKDAFRKFITDTTKMPLELMFLGRNMRIVQSCNQMMGSPVNRIKILAHWASRSLTTIPDMTFRQRAGAWKNHILFTLVVALSDVGFWVMRLRQLIPGLSDKGFEDELEQQVRSVMKNKFGLEVSQDAFQS
ncbi:ABC1 family-domain-containing protein [Lipomyces arxii]|uniref:ABC1 family-domain-containing protein n=1 Tax=Lipomyces arxii TaxID=56418 RepID=UPI0034CD86E3